MARQAPFHAFGDLLADQAPLMRTLPAASRSVHVPVTPPLSWASAVQVPAKLRPLEDALQTPRSSAPEARIAETARVARIRAKDILLNLAPSE
jgi:hypothetical protein